jgi:nitronate monooxygenase
MREDLKRNLRSEIAAGNIEVRCSPDVSPSGYPFMLGQEKGTLSDKEIYEKRNMNRPACKHGYLVQDYWKSDGSIGFRCSAEPVEIYKRKGGKEEDTKGKVCLCEGLIATVAGHAGGDPAIITLGKDLSSVKEIMRNKEDGMYSAEEAVRYTFSKQ